MGGKKDCQGGQNFEKRGHESVQYKRDAVARRGNMREGEKN